MGKQTDGSLRTNTPSTRRGRIRINTKRFVVQNTSHEESVTTAKLSTDTLDKIEVSANDELRSPPEVPCPISIQWDDFPFNVASIFRRGTYLVRTSVNTLTDAMLIVASLIGTSVDLNQLNRDLLALAWRKSMKMIDSPPLRTANREVLSVMGILPLFVYLDD